MVACEYRQAEEIRDAFARHNVRYLFIGKSGFVLLGFPDTTRDAVLFVNRTPENGEALATWTTSSRAKRLRTVSRTASRFLGCDRFATVGSRGNPERAHLWLRYDRPAEPEPKRLDWPSKTPSVTDSSAVTRGEEAPCLPYICSVR